MLKKILLSLASMLLLLLLAEGVLQLIELPPQDYYPWVSDKATGFRIAPNLRQRMVSNEFDVEIRTNASGFRDDAVNEKRGFRILLLGDSFAFGYGVERGSLFADILEHQLQTELINAAVGGFDIIHQLRWYREYGKELHADLVVYALYLGNDLSGNTYWQECDDGALVNPQQQYPVRARWASKILQIVGKLVYQYRYGAMQQKEWIPFPDYLMMTRKQLTPEGEMNYEVAKELLGELQAEVTTSGAELFVFMFPYRTAVEPQARDRLRATIPDFDELYDLEKPSIEMEKFLEKRNIAYLNLLSALKGHYETPANELLYYYSDGHFTSAGHAFVAARLEPIITSLIDRK